MDNDLFLNTYDMLNEVLSKYSSIKMADEPIINDEQLNENNLSNFFKLYSKEANLMKYFDKETKTTNYKCWNFTYDGHQSFYILYDISNKCWYAIAGGGDFYPDPKYKKLKLGSIDLVTSGRYWCDIWRSKYVINILEILFKYKS